VARPAAKKFKCAATVAAAGSKKKKLPSIIKKYSSDWSELGATWQLQRFETILQGKVPKTKWVDELQRADELTEPVSVTGIIFLPEKTDDEVKEMQAEDADLGPIVEWLKDGRQPTSDYLKSKSLDTRTVWAQVPAIHLLDGILVHKFSDQCVIQLVVPTAL